MNLRRLFAVWHARNLEFLRDRSTLVFNFLFPLALVVAFAVIFGGQPRPLFKVDVVAPPGAALDAGLHPFLATRYVDFVRIGPEAIDATIRKVERHQVDLLLDLRASPRYWVNEDSPKGYLAEKLLLEAAGGKASREPVSGAAVRYVDWLLPGILGMNMMFSCLFGVGYVVVRYRKSGFLRRLSATPVTALEFGTAQVLSRLLLTVSVTSLLYAALALFVSFRNEGSVPARLMGRHWVITDSNGKVQEVRGDVVVGEQPHLKPGQKFRYSSGAVLETPVGSMQGSYQMVADDGETFDAPIAAFRLAMPGLLH